MGLGVNFIEQERPLGLAHAAKVGSSFLGNEPFVMYLRDNPLGQGIGNLIHTFEESSSDAVVLLKEVADPHLFGVAELDGNGRVVRLVEKPQNPPSI